MDVTEALKKFLLNVEKFEILKKNFHRIRINIIFGLALLTITDCNGGKQKPKKRGYSFTEAVCYPEIYEGTGFQLESAFRYGFDVLHNYLNEKSLPAEEHMQYILSRLITFLTDDDSQKMLTKIIDEPKIKETDLTLRLAHHFFSKLSPAKEYKLDKYSKKRRDICPCGCDEKINGQFADTSIGNPKCWHGNLDILLGSSDLGVKVEIEKEISPYCASIEVKDQPYKSYIENERVTNQIVAQTVVFSFLQKQRHPEYEQFLIPSTGVSKEELIFYFYDSQYDVLLRSRAFDLFDGDDVCGTTVLVAWLVLNYKYLCSGITEGMMKAPKANFFNFAKDQLQLYENQLTLGNVVFHRESRCYSLDFNVPDEFDFSEPYVKKKKTSDEASKTATLDLDQS